MIRAFQWDLARQVERLDVLLSLLPQYAAWGYQELYLHLEDAVDYPNLPGVARKDAYRWSELELLVQRAKAVGIGVVPIINLLGHTQYLVKTEAWRDLNELRAADGSPLPVGQICPLHPRIPELVERLLKDVRPLCTAGKVHLGLDESFHLGKCPRCRQEVADIGLHGHFARHVLRLHDRVSEKGLRMGIWADMLALLPEAIPLLPRGLIAYDWYYYPFSRKPRLELYGFREYDLAPALKRRGISYWGCPMNGAFRYEPVPVFNDRLRNIRSWWRRCRSVKAEGMLITSWEPFRLNFRLPVAVDAAAASLWCDRPPSPSMRRGFARVFGAKGAAACADAARILDSYPFSGYYAWESLRRWDGGITLEPPSRLAKVVKALERVAPTGVPAMDATLRFRRFLAQRDAFIAGAARTVSTLRQPEVNRRAELARALRAANDFCDALLAAHADATALWNDTRSANDEAPNLQMLADDGRRLTAWIRWIEGTGRDPIRAFEPSPVFGRWRLSFNVEVHQPAVQRVSVEAQDANAEWKELAFRHTIEFQGRAAARRVSYTHPFAVSIDEPTQPLRIAVGGIGEVLIRNLMLSDGLCERALTGPDGSSVLHLGRPAPTDGWPDLSAPPITALLLPARLPQDAGKVRPSRLRSSSLRPRP